MRHAPDFVDDSVQLERCFDAERLNALVNHPDIRPHVGGDPDFPIDLTGALVGRNVFLLGEYGGFGLTWCAPGVYEVHTFILPQGRGAWALAAVRTGLAIMQAAYSASHIWTRVKPDAKAVRMFTRAAGFAHVGREEFDIGVGPEPFEIYEWRA
jgi:hypothetical protein